MGLDDIYRRKRPYGNLLYIMITLAMAMLFPIVVSADASAYGLNYIGNTFGESAIPTSDGGYILTGATDPYDKDEYSVYLLKVDAGGNTLWKRTYDFLGYDHGSCVVQASDGGYIVAGTTGNNIEGDRIFLMKTDAGGNLTWNRTYGRTGGDEGNFVSRTSDGGYIIVGDANSFSNNTNDDIYIVKTDANGNMSWDRTYGDAKYDFGEAVVQADDGGYAIVGLLNSMCEKDMDICLVKTDADGNIIWGRTFGGNMSDVGLSIALTNDNGYIVTGSIEYVIDRTEEYIDYREYMYLIRTDADGDVIWNKMYSGVREAGGISVSQTRDGGFIAIGSSWSADSDGVYIVKTDASGNVVWEQVFKGIGGGKTIMQANDGGYIISGTSSGPFNNKFAGYLLKIDANGKEEWHNTYDENYFKPASGMEGLNPYMLSGIGTFAVLFVIVAINVYSKRKK